jgi:hypothetical protein
MTGPRILMSASDDPMRLESAYFRYMREAGADVQGWTTASKPTMVAPSLVSRVIARLLPGRRQGELGRDLMAHVEAKAPEVLFLFKAMDIRPAVLKAIRARGVKLVNYNADHPLEYFSRGSGNANVRDAIPFYDLYVTYSENIAGQLRAAHSDLAVGVVPFGHEVDDARFQRIAAEAEVPRACFLGNPDEQRVAAIRTLADAGIPIDVYGFGWPKFLSPGPLVTVNGPLHGDAMMAALRRYRLQLNVFRPHNADSHNMRSFEVPACGGIMLAEDSSEHRRFFEAGQEAFYFKDPAAMVEGARHLMALSSGEADAVRVAARARSVSSGYHYADRARTMWGLIKNIHSSEQPVADSQ